MKRSRATAWLERWSRWVYILPLFVLEGIFLTQIAVMAGDPGGSVLPLDVQLWYTADEVAMTLGAMTTAQRSLAAWMHLTLDILHPAIYGFLLATLLYRVNPQARWWQLAPVIVLTDLLENALLAALYWTYPSLLGWVPLMALVTAVKWTLVALSLFFLVQGIFASWTARVLQRIEE